MKLDYLSVLRRECDRCSRLDRVVPHDAVLPHLPGWTVHDLVAHLAGDYRWAQGIITSRVAPRIGLRPVAFSGDALCNEWDAAARELLELLTFADPDGACPNFAEGDTGTLRWWSRHQALETTLHRWDMEVPTGEHAPIAADLALDGIDELWSVYAVRYSPHNLSTTLTLRCPDHRRGWAVSPAGQGRIEVMAANDLASADLEGSPQGLLLALWQRVPLADASLCVNGDAAALQGFFDGPLTA